MPDTEQRIEVMGNTIATVTATTLDAATPAVRRHVAAAHRALKDLEPTPARIARAAHTVGVLRADGFSIRGIVAVMSVAGGASGLPAGKGTIERLAYVADGVAGEWPDVGDAATHIAHVLYRIAQTGTAADVARAAEMGRKSTDGDSAVAAVTAVRDELNKAQHKSLTTPPVREVAGEAADGGKVNGKDDNSEHAEPSTPSAPAEHTVTEVLSAAGTSALIAELTRRYKGRAATIAAADVDALSALLSRVSGLIERDKVTR